MQTQQATTWQAREAALTSAYEALARRQNALGLCRSVPATVSTFYDRPFNVIHGGKFAQALAEQITAPKLQRLAAQRRIGNVDLWSDNTDIGALPHANLLHLYD